LWTTDCSKLQSRFSFPCVCPILGFSSQIGSKITLQWKPLNVIALGQRQSDNINQKVTIYGSTKYIKSKLGRSNIDRINRMITLSLITLSGFHCLTKNIRCDIVKDKSSVRLILNGQSHFITMFG
jgi:hypothetical protein